MYALNYDVWGDGDPWIVCFSVGQMICAIYSVMFCTWEKGTVLTILWYMRWMLAGIYLLEAGIILFPLLSALFGLVMADHLGIYMISENLVSAIVLSLLPFSLLVGFTACSINSRYYEIFDEDRIYSEDKSHSFISKQQADLLLATYMQLPSEDPNSRRRLGSRGGIPQPSLVSQEPTPVINKIVYL